jgi:hypothetical protein
LNPEREEGSVGEGYRKPCVLRSVMFGKQEFGVKCDTEVADMGVPWDYSMLEVDWCWGGRAASSEWSTIHTSLSLHNMVDFL